MELRVERLVGKRVRGPDGKIAGRIEEFVVVREGLRRVLSEIHLGPAALLERLSAPIVDHPRGWRVKWEQIDLADPEHPRLRVPVTDLEPLHAARSM